MTAPAEKSHAGEKHSGGLAQVVRWLTEERPIAGPDDVGFVGGAPRRTAGWTYGAPPARPEKPDVEPEILSEVRIGPAPRCAVAGETIALSVSLINSRGDIYLGWPIKLEWSSSDPSVAIVNEFGVVDVLARGRVEVTCTCEGKSGSVLLTVVEPAVAVAVGLPVPTHLRPAPPLPEPRSRRSRRVHAEQAFPAPAHDAAIEKAVPLVVVEGADLADAAAMAADETGPAPASAALATRDDGVPLPPGTLEVPAAQAQARRSPPADLSPASTPRPTYVVSAASVPAFLPEPAPVYRRSVERGSVRHGALTSLALSRGTRRFVFRLAVGAATGALIAIVLSRSPEEVFVVDPEPTTSFGDASGRAAARRAPVARPVARTAVGLPASAVAPTMKPSLPALADTSASTTLTAAGRRTVSEDAGSAALTSPTQAEPRPPAPVAAATSPAPSTVTRVVLASSPSQLTEGETVRLSAAGVDDRGGTVSDRLVSWKSENEDVAVVDPDGVVTARRPGTATIVATFPADGRSGRVTLTVGARRAPEPAVSRENGRAAAAQVMSARIDEFVTALRERNGSRVAALYNAESPQDRKNLQALLERLRRPEARLKASDPALGTLEVREMEAAVDFQIAMSWTSSFGRVRSQTSAFRAVLEPGDGGWRLVAIKSLGKID